MVCENFKLFGYVYDIKLNINGKLQISLQTQSMQNMKFGAKIYVNCDSDNFSAKDYLPTTWWSNILQFQLEFLF